MPEEILSKMLAYAILPELDQRLGIIKYNDNLMVPENDHIDIKVLRLDVNKLFRRLAKSSYFDENEHMVILYAVSDWDGPFTWAPPTICSINFEVPTYLLKNVRKLGIEIGAIYDQWLHMFVDTIGEIVMACSVLARLTLYLDNVDDSFAPLIERQMLDILKERQKRTGQVVKLVLIGANHDAEKIVPIPYLEFGGPGGASINAR